MPSPLAGMPVIRMVLEGDGGLEGRKDDIIHHGHDLTLLALPGGMKSGKPSVAFAIETDKGLVVVESSLWLLVSCARALVAKYGEPG
jgi:hypothetical protein